MKIISTLICVLLFLNLFSQNVGIGTNTPNQKLEVDGAIKIGTTTEVGDGSIRYNNDFEGYANGKWNSFTKNKNQQLFSYGFSSTLRKSTIFSADSMIVSETGNYMIILNVNGNNFSSYGPTGVVNIDYSGEAWVAKLNFGAITDRVPFFTSYSDNAGSAGGYVKYIPAYSSTTTVTYLNAGDILKLASYVDANYSTPGNIWSVKGFKIVLVKISD